MTASRRSGSAFTGSSSPAKSTGTNQGDDAIDLTDKSVLVTGMTGSLGNALAVRLLSSPNPPRRLLCLSRDELKQHEMVLRTANLPHADRLRFLLGDVRDRDRLYRAFDGVDYIVHAAALKQVPAGERDPFEFVQTNILGARNIIEAAIDRGVSRVLALSTDKACNPVNLYGASKLVSEKLFMAASSYVGSRQTRFSAVRYGNVAGSRGSVIPIWQEHARRCRAGEERAIDGQTTHFCPGIELTDERMTRFWITLPQAVDFVLASLDRMTGGEVFVPKLPSVKMTDVAEAVVDWCKVRVTGIRPGEKISESLIGPDEPRDDRGDHYVIGHGPTGAAYASDTNFDWLTVPQIQEALRAF